jgi:hypothetical protein
MRCGGRTADDDPHTGHTKSWVKRFQVMANIQNRFPENVIGELFVDSTCIDSETCQQLAPETFENAGNHRFV